MRERAGAARTGPRVGAQAAARRDSERRRGASMVFSNAPGRDPIPVGSSEPFAGPTGILPRMPTFGASARALIFGASFHATACSPEDTGHPLGRAGAAGSGSTGGASTGATGGAGGADATTTSSSGNTTSAVTTGSAGAGTGSAGVGGAGIGGSGGATSGGAG